MKKHLFILSILLLPAVAFSQSASKTNDPNGKQQAASTAQITTLNSKTISDTSKSKSIAEQLKLGKTPQQINAELSPQKPSISAVDLYNQSHPSPAATSAPH